MRGDDELETLLNEIPHATSHDIMHRRLHQRRNTDCGRGSFGTYWDYGVSQMSDDEPSSHKYTFASSPVSGVSLQSDGSASTLFSGGYSLSDHGSPTPSPVEELKSEVTFSGPRFLNGLWLDSETPSSSATKNTGESLIDGPYLYKNHSSLYSSDEQINRPGSRDFSAEPNARQCSLSGTSQAGYGLCSDYYSFKRGFSDYWGVQAPVSGTGQGFVSEVNPEFFNTHHGCSLGSLPFSQSDAPDFNSPMNSPRLRKKEQMDNYYHRGSPISYLTTSLGGLSIADVLSAQRGSMHLREERDALGFCSQTHLGHHFNGKNVSRYGLAMSNVGARVPLNIGVPQGGLGALAVEDSFIIQGEGLDFVVNKGLGQSRVQGNSSPFPYNIGAGKLLGKAQLEGQRGMTGYLNRASSPKMCCPFSMQHRDNSLAEAQGHIYPMAKDQQGCRFLQRMFAQGSRQAVQVIFNEIIHHAVELMMDPFGNYLMQKLLEVCTEEQRMQIIAVVTEEPGDLVKISLNSHGTRAVQKLIETLKTRQQILMVTSALEPGFLALIKDLNGNHVVQRCLQCFSKDYNQFIFVSAAKHCVDIATHKHGCCVLQRCISHATGDNRENLVEEISTNGLLLAQDAYGNYVVQFILELGIPSATSTLISQFEGNYVHLSIQRFGSHVVEKCLKYFNDIERTRIIHELLSAPHFERLLQDPHANYVIQTALHFAEGPVYNSLVEAIEFHKPVSCNSPYSKRIFSQKLLKKRCTLLIAP